MLSAVNSWSGVLEVPTEEWVVSDRRKLEYRHGQA